MALTEAELATQKRYRERHPERKAASARAAKQNRSAEVLERDRARTKEWYRSQGGKEWMRRYKIKLHYGLEYDEYEALLIQQSGRCAICLSAAEPDKDLVVDHCHNSSVVRGLLCTTCNVGIGMLREDPNIFASALAYLGGQ